MTSKCKTCDTCNLCKCEKFQPEDEIIVKDWKQKGCGKQFCYVKDCKMGCFLCHIHFLCPSCSNQSPQRRSETPNKKQNEGTQTLSDIKEIIGIPIDEVIEVLEIYKRNKSSGRN